MARFIQITFSARHHPGSAWWVPHTQRSNCGTTSDQKTWRVLTAVSALRSRNTFVRLPKRGAAQIQTLKTLQSKRKTFMKN